MTVCLILNVLTDQHSDFYPTGRAIGTVLLTASRVDTPTN